MRALDAKVNLAWRDIYMLASFLGPQLAISSICFIGFISAVIKNQPVAQMKVRSYG